MSYFGNIYEEVKETVVEDFMEDFHEILEDNEDNPEFCLSCLVRSLVEEAYAEGYKEGGMFLIDNLGTEDEDEVIEHFVNLNVYDEEIEEEYLDEDYDLVSANENYDIEIPKEIDSIHIKDYLDTATKINELAIKSKKIVDGVVNSKITINDEMIETIVEKVTDKLIQRSKVNIKPNEIIMTILSKEI